MEKENFGMTFEKRMADRITAAFMHVVRALVALSIGELGEAQHRLGLAHKRLTDVQGDLSDEITKRREHPITSIQPDPSISMVLRKTRK